MRFLHFYIGEGVGLGNVGHRLGNFQVRDTWIILFHILIVQYLSQFLVWSQEFTSKWRTARLDSLFTFLRFAGFLWGLGRVSHARAQIPCLNTPPFTSGSPLQV